MSRGPRRRDDRREVLGSAWKHSHPRSIHRGNAGATRAASRSAPAAALIMFDGGTGLRLLGEPLLKELPIELHLFSATFIGITSRASLSSPGVRPGERVPPLRWPEGQRHAREHARRADGEPFVPRSSLGDGRAHELPRPLRRRGPRAARPRRSRRRQRDHQDHRRARQPPERRLRVSRRFRRARAWSTRPTPSTTRSSIPSSRSSRRTAISHLRLAVHARGVLGRRRSACPRSGGATAPLPKP